MTLWILMALMCLVAIVFVALPLYRASNRLTPTASLIIVLVAVLSAGLYAHQGNPDVPSGRSTGGQQSMDEAIATLAARLKEEPGDVNGWIMLGRSYLSVQQFAKAVEAFEKAVALQESRDAQTLVSLGEALLYRDQTEIAGRPATLFETAVELDPMDQKALFYSGIAAGNRGDTELAIERWERLATLDPPQEIRDILGRQIAAWGGEPMEELPPQHPPIEPQPAAAPQDDAIVAAAISLSGEAAAALTSEAIVFIIARDPAQPSPPIAVTRRLLSDLPTVVNLTDAESMVQGRNLSDFESFELLVRVSLSGTPVAQSGDWFSSAVVTPAEQNTIELTVDQRVP